MCKYNRFPLCSCKHTIPIAENETYAIYNGDSIIFVQGSDERTIRISSDKKLIANLPNVNFLHEYEIREEILAEINDIDKNVQKHYSVSEMLLHKLYYRNSEVYRALYDNEYYDVSKQLLYGKQYKNFDEKMINRDLAEFGNYLSNIQAECRSLLLLDYYLYGYSAYAATNLSVNNIDMNMLEDMLENTQFDFDTLLKFVGELGSVMLRGVEIVQSIKDYDFYTTELKKWFNKKFSLSLPIYNNLHLAQIAYRMYQRNGLLAYKKYVSKFDKQFPETIVDGYTIKSINADEISTMPFNTLPQEDITEPLLAAIKDNKIVSLILNVDDRIFIRGLQTDEIKGVFNHYFDLLETILYKEDFV